MALRIEQRVWTGTGGWESIVDAGGLPNAQLVLWFGGGSALKDLRALEMLRERYPHARFIGCSTAGEIAGTRVLDDSITATALQFDHTVVRTAIEPIDRAVDSEQVGERIGAALAGEALAHVVVLAEGIHINGSELLVGLRKALPDHVTVTGGLAADGPRFQRTIVCDSGDVTGRRVAAIGFYGDRFEVGYGSFGGWDPFGPERIVTRSEGNMLYELDGYSALALYRDYLGPYAADLPSSGLLFPLSVIGADGRRIVRTILSVDDAAGSLTFAGDIPMGAQVQLMRANFDRLIDGASQASDDAHRGVERQHPALALLISCVGRRLVLKQRIEEELDAVQETLGASVPLCGFYSYGEIAPFGGLQRCELHNQTMTITTFNER
jgi:hypothetical protein